MELNIYRCLFGFLLAPGLYKVSVCILHIFNNMELPISLFSFKSYSIYAGVQDALVQWWAQMLGTIFSIMLIASSLGGMLNSLLTDKRNLEESKKKSYIKIF